MTPIYWRELAAGVPGATLVDVRTADEYALGHLDGAVNVPLDDLRERLGEIPADKPVVVYCGVGLRGYLASIILKANGYTDVRNLVGGLRTYETATRPVCHPEDVGASNASQAESAYSDGSPAPETASTLTLDACGLSCPGPIIKLKQSMEDMRPGRTAYGAGHRCRFSARRRSLVPKHRQPLPASEGRRRHLHRDAGRRPLIPPKP